MFVCGCGCVFVCFVFQVRSSSRYLAVCFSRMCVCGCGCIGVSDCVLCACSLSLSLSPAPAPVDFTFFIFTQGTVTRLARMPRVVRRHLRDRHLAPPPPPPPIPLAFLLIFVPRRQHGASAQASPPSRYTGPSPLHLTHPSFSIFRESASCTFLNHASSPLVCVCVRAFFPDFLCPSFPLP